MKKIEKKIFYEYSYKNGRHRVGLLIGIGPKKELVLLDVLDKSYVVVSTFASSDHDYSLLPAKAIAEIRERLRDE